MKRDFTKLLDLEKSEAEYLLERTKFLKKMHRAGSEYKPLKDKSLAMIFEKASTRTRISFEVGMKQLGGHAILLNAGETQIGRGEPIQDTARVLSRYVDGIMIRTFSQELVEELARWAVIPVINGLTDLYHPCQILADLFTIVEKKGTMEGRKIAFIGDGNNVANSWIESAILLGLDFSIATPEGYEPPEELMERARRQAGRFRHTNDPLEAARGADVINTDVWVSMGMEEEKEDRRRIFSRYAIDEGLMAVAAPDAIVMHCLPAHRSEEITESVFERFQDVIFTQAENRLHAQKALLEWIIKT